jgi:hypothetical protein
MSHFFTVVHMVWIRRETRKEMSAGDEDIRQLKDDAYSEEEGRDTKGKT